MVAVLVAWEILSATGALPPRYFPTLPDLVSALVDLVSSGAFWTAVGATLEGWAIGMVIAAALALPIGMLLASSKPLYLSLRAVIEFLRPIPSVAIIPLAVLIYGTNLQMKVFLVAYACFWPMLVQTIYGVREVDPVARDTARSFGLGRGEQMLRVTVPSALPYVATGLRISSAIALILSVTAELVVGTPGLGKSILVAENGGAVAEMYALIAVTGVLGLALNQLFRRAERHTLHWHMSQRREVAV